MDQPWIKYGSTWINVDQLPSACPFSLSLQPVPSACPFSMSPCVLTHGSCVMRQASHSRGMRHASGVPLTWHASGVRLMRHASTLQASCVRRPASDSTCPIQPIQPIQPPPVVGHDDNTAAEIPMLLLLDLRPLRCMAWGNRVVLPPSYNAMGAIVRIKTAGDAPESAARCCYSTKKAGIMPAPVPEVVRLVGDLFDHYLTA